MKVGKAIYNILSQSTDVQSNFPFNTTDYSPTGTELVTNGDFSATGGELITNGDFSATSATKILDGDFPLPNVNWQVIPTTTINGGSATIEGLGSLIATGNNWGVAQDVTGHDVGKSYKVTFTAKQLTGVGAMYGGVGYVNQFNQIITADYVTYTFYQTITTTGSNWDEVAFGGVLATGVEVTNTFEIKDVSVKELGEGWVSVDETNTFGENGLTMTSTEAADVKIYQANVITSDKSYKVTYTIHENGLTGTNAIQYYTGSATNGYDDLPDQSVGTHTFYYTAPSVANDRWYYKLDLRGGSTSTTDFVTISSISVEELGEGWTVGDKWSLSDEGARLESSTSAASGLSQSDIFEIGKSYKVTLDSVVNSGTAKLEKSAGGTQFQITETKTYVEYFEATRTDFYLNRVTTDSDIYINNISVEEMVLNKIFPELAPPDIDAPYVVYSVVSNSPSETKNTNGDIDTANIEVYGFQDTYNKAVDLGVSVRAALDRKTGTYNTIEIQSTNYVNEQMDVNEARKLWAAIQDYTIRIKNI